MKVWCIAIFACISSGCFALGPTALDSEQAWAITQFSSINESAEVQFWVNGGKTNFKYYTHLTLEHPDFLTQMQNAYSNIKDHHNTHPKVVFIGSKDTISQATHIFSHDNTMSVDFANAIQYIPISEFTVPSEQVLKNKSLETLKDRIPSKEEIKMGFAQGVGMGIIDASIFTFSRAMVANPGGLGLYAGILGGTLYIFTAEGLTYFIKTFVSAFLTRLVVMGGRPLLSSIKTLFDNQFSKINNTLIKNTLSLSYKIFIDILIGLSTYHAFKVALGCYPASMGFELMAWDQLKHSVSDLWSYAYIMAERDRIISRKTANSIAFYKPFLSTGIGAARLNGMAIGHHATYFLTILGIISYVVNWRLALHLIGNGEVVIGADLNPRYIPNNLVKGHLYITQNLEEHPFLNQSHFNNSRNRYIKKQFIGLTPAIESKDRVFDLDPIRLTISLDHVKVYKATSRYPITSRRKKNLLLHQYLTSKYGSAHSQQMDSQITLNLDDRAVSYANDTKTFTTVHGGEAYNVEVQFSKPKLKNKAHDYNTEQAYWLIDGLWKLKNLHIASFESIKDGEYIKGYTVEIKPPRIYKKDTYFFIKDAAGKLVNVPEGLLKYVLYWIELNDARGRFYDVILPSGPFSVRVASQIRYIKHIIKNVWLRKRQLKNQPQRTITRKLELIKNGMDCK